MVPGAEEDPGNHPSAPQMLRSDLPRALSREDVDDVALVVCVGRTTRGRERRDACV